jgi:hypothetical protein
MKKPTRPARKAAKLLKPDDAKKRPARRKPIMRHGRDT